MTSAFVSSRPSRQKMETAEAQAIEFQCEFGQLDASELLEVMINQKFSGNIALVSSFGTEAAVLLALIAEIDCNTPVIFIETGKHFPETLSYRDEISSILGLTDVRSINPSPIDLSAHDPDGHLWSKNPNLCCYLRKVLSLEKALSGFKSWVTGRKQYQTGERVKLPKIEASNGRIKINPLAEWDQFRIKNEFEARKLPLHPLTKEQYKSIGCLPCTRPVKIGESDRDGRWAGIEKSECGIHTDPNRSKRLDI